MERIQILLETTDRRALEQLAAEAHTSMSDILRDLLRERVKQQRHAKMRKAAKIMAEAYTSDPELTALTALDGDEVLDAPQ
jgi:metal-responsive CopG/Arc/MetJ family transcriptional regulator